MTTQKLILISVPVDPVSVVDDLQKKLGPGYKVKYTASEQLEDDAAIDKEDWKNVEAVLMYRFPSFVQSVQDTPKLRLVQLASAGYNHITPTPFWKSLPEDHPLTIASASGIHVVPIAEHVIMTTMALQHLLPTYVLNQSRSSWNRDAQAAHCVRELRGSTMGVLGYGHIGRECARMAKALGMNVVAATRSGKKSKIGGYLTEGTGDHDGEIPSAWYSTEDKKSLAEFYSRSDVLVNSLPSSDSTHKFVDAAAFRSLPLHSVFVNIGRGDTVDQQALISALEESTPEEERIGGASLDVTDPEPLESSSKLWSLKNVLITPHVSGASDQYWHRATDLFGINVKRLFEEDKGALNAVRGRKEDE